MKLLGKALSALLFFTVLAGWLKPEFVHGQPSPKAIILAWDGAVPAFVRELLREAKLPNLAKLIEGGAFADGVSGVFPSFTASSFASLWTGAPPSLTGISGNRVPRMPRSQFTILESSSGFDSAPMQAEPLWMPADRSGRKIVISHGPFSGEKSARIVRFDGYSGISGRDGVVTSRTTKPRSAIGWTNLPPSALPPLEINFTIGAAALFGLFIDDPSEPLEGYDTLVVTESKDGEVKAKLKAGLPKPDGATLWSGVIDLKFPGEHNAGTYLRLFELKADGSDFLLYFTRPTRQTVSPPELLDEAKSSMGAFIGNGASRLYSQGAFGPPIPKGGSGLAEVRYLETVAIAQRQFMETSLWALQNLPWDMFFAYTPFPDEAEHLWRGYLESALPGARKELAQRLRPFLEQVYRICDEFLGLMMAHRPDNTIMALVSDHGMEGIHRLVAINRALQQGGVLVTDENGQVALAKTKAFYPPMSNGYLLINTTDRKSGIVGPEERPEVVQKIRDLLLAIRDGEQQVVANVYDPEKHGVAMGIGGDSGGDIYVDLLPGYDFDSRTGPGDIVSQREPYGMHGFNPARPSMRTLMVLNGPGIARGQKLHDVRLIDFAPTLAKLLNIPSPKHATGQVLEAALVKTSNSH